MGCMISNVLSNWLKAVCDNGVRVVLGSNLILYTVTAECAVIDLLVIYRARHNCPFPYLLDKYICTPSLKVPGYGVMRQIKNLLTMLLAARFCTAQVKESRLKTFVMLRSDGPTSGAFST